MPGEVNVTLKWTRGIPPFITTGALTSATVGAAYTFTLAFTGTPTPTIALQSGTLPAGLSVSSAGVISGTPTVTATTTGLVFRATNSAGYADSSSLSLVVNASGSYTLLQPSDIAYVGYYDVYTNGLDNPFSKGLTVRRYGSEVRLITKHFGSYSSDFAEFSLSGKTPATSGTSAANQITTTTQTWPTTYSSYDGNQYIYWDEATSKLFMTSARDYPGSGVDVDTKIYTATLVNGTGTTNLKRLSLTGVPDRRAGSGIVSVPSSFQAQYGVGPFAVGLGSYYSLVEDFGQAAMGLSLYAIPDPAPFSDGTSLSTGQYKSLAVRGYNVNYFGRSLELPTNNYGAGTPLSPGVDGLGYWVWGNKYAGGFFIDGPTKKAFVAIASIATGDNSYISSSLSNSGYIAEAHIYNPDDLGRISQGTQSAILDPIAANMKSLSETRVTSPSGTYYTSQIIDAAYDSVGKTIYIMFQGRSSVNGYWNRIYAYSVNA